MAFTGSIEQLARLEKLREQRFKIDAKQRALNDSIMAENRSLYTDDEERQWNELDNSYNDIDAEIRELERFEDGKLTSQIGSEVLNEEKRMEPANNSHAIYDKRAIQMAVANDNYVFNESGNSLRDAFNKYLRYGWNGVTAKEARNLQADLDTYGGFAVTPGEVARQILHNLNNDLWIRQLATIWATPKAESLGVATLDSDPDAPTWTAEIQTGTSDSSMDFNKRELFPHPLAKRIRVSERLLRASVVNMEDFVISRLLFTMGETLENAYMTGDGAGNPLGIFVTSSIGIPSSQDVSTDNTSSSVKADNIRRVVGTLKSQYRRKAAFVMHRDVESQIARLKDGEGNYLWRQGLDRQPNTLLGYPIYVSEYAPNTFSAGEYMYIFGDFSYYWIMDSLAMQVKRLDELYAETAEIGFISRYEGDGAPVLSEAFVRSKLG